MLSKVFLDKKKYESYNLLNEKDSLIGLGKINVFIGQNNTGKSRFLRTLFSDSNFEFQLKKNDFNKIISLIGQKREEIRNIFDSIYIKDAGTTFKDIDEIQKQIGNFKIGKVKGDVEKVRRLANNYSRLQNFTSWAKTPGIVGGRNPSVTIPNINNIGREILELLNKLFPPDFDYKVERIYIPILKGLRPIQMDPQDEFREQRDNYKSRTLRDYFTTTDSKKIEGEIFTGLNLYEDTKKLLLGNKEGRDRIKKFEEFLGKTFFDDLEVTLIPDINNDVLLIGIGNEERPVYELGDGIQSIIILLYPLFFNQDKNLLVFIEEPENSMHPGMQRIFLETLMKKEFNNFQFFITTHSNHFLDITLDLDNISIYTFSKIKNEKSNDFSYQIENTSNDDIRILDLIGARNASVFLSNCTIWVEGITDRLYLKKYLEVYQKKLINEESLKNAFKEDFNYSFIEYGGGNIVHWSFTNELGWDKIQTSRLSSKIFVVADKDSSEEKPNSAKASRLKELKEKLKNRFRVVDGREIENTLSESVIINVIKKLEGENASLVEYDDKRIKFKKYQNLRLGKFIESNFKNLKRKYQADSGTIYCKLEFCKTAIELISTINDLTPEAVDIAKNIFDFISNSNKN